jgi:hypothetical protein
MNCKLSFFSLAIFFAVTVNAQSAQNPLYNPAADPAYDGNLNVNDMVIAVDKGAALKTMKVFQKKDGMYQLGTKDITAWEIKNSPNALKWYKANSVYPYFDENAFNARTGKYKSVVAAYLLCFSQKYKLNVAIVTGSTNWPTYYIKDNAEHDDQQKKLEELFQIIDKEFPSLPNTFLSYTQNPAIWKLVARDRVELLECLSKVENPDITKTIDRYLKEIASAKTAAQNFTGGTSDLYNGTTYSWMLRAVSKKAREDYIATQKGWNTNAGAVSKINTALDELKTICSPKIAMLKMENNLFQYHDAASEALMKGYLKNPGLLKILKTGISDADWLIEKNDLGIPLYRYKRGTMWVRNNTDDHPYCKGLFFVIKQDYSGGGTYGKSFISEYSEELKGCL